MQLPASTLWLSAFFCAAAGFFAPTAPAATPDPSDVFLSAYQDFRAAERLESGNEPARALAQYRKVEDQLTQLIDASPDWQPIVVKYRLKKTREALFRLESDSSVAASAQVDVIEDYAGPLPAGDESSNTNLPQVTTTPRARMASSPDANRVPQTPYRPSPRTATAPSSFPSTPGRISPGTTHSGLGDAMRQIAELQRQLAASQQENVELTSHLDLLRKDATRARREADQAKVGVVEMKSQLAQANDTIQNLKLEIPDPVKVHQEREDQMSAFLVKLAESDAEAEALREENARLGSKLSRAANYIEVSRKVRSQLESERKKFAGETTQLREQAGEAAREIQALQSKLATAETAVSEGQSLLAALRVEKDQRDQRIAELELENRQLAPPAPGPVISESERQIAALNDQMSARIEALERELTERTASEQTVQSLNAEIQAISLRLADAEKSLAERDTRISRLTQDLDTAKSTILAMRTRPSDPSLLAENEMLRGIILRQIRQQNQRESAREAIRAQLTELEVESRSLESQLEVLAAPIIELTRDEHTLFAEKVALLPREEEADLIMDLTISKPDGPGPVGADSLTEKDHELVQLAQEHFNRAEFGRAAEIYSELASRTPDNYFVLSNLGAVQLENGQPADAAATFRKALELAPNDSFARTHLGVALTRQADYQKAMGVLEHAVEVNPEDSIARNYLGVCYAQTGNRSASEKQLKRAIELNSNYANAHFNLAVLYATVQPVAIDLAKQHYHMAKQLGASPDASLENLIH